MSDLFSRLKKDFKIARLTPGDVFWESDHLNNFNSLILENLDSYPKIDHWLANKVLPEIGSSSRIAYVGYLEEKPIVSAVLKCGSHSKFCHLKIPDNHQSFHLGELFFSLMTFDVQNMANDIHFTLPSSLWDEKKDFFNSFGFEEFAKSGKQYRLFDEELKCSAPFNKVWESTIEKLPKLLEIFTVSGFSMNPPFS